MWTRAKKVKAEGQPKVVSTIVLKDGDGNHLLSLYVDNGVVVANYRPENLDDAAEALMNTIRWSAR